MDEMKGPGRAMLATILLAVGGVLNVIYGIAAISNSKFFSHHNFVFGNLKTWGWIALVFGVLEILASVSLARGHTYGRLFGIAMGSVAAISALLDIPAYPFWSLAVFAISVWIVYGLTLGDADDLWDVQPGDAGMMISSRRAIT